MVIAVRDYLLACIITLLLSFGLESTNAQSLYRITGERKVAWNSIVVDQSGRGDFTTIQSAIDAVPSDNKVWVSIYIREGTYREKVVIPYDKPYIILKGKKKSTTTVVWDDHDSASQSPTFTSLADNIVVKCISFVNSYNYPIGERENPRVPAVAALVSGDKSTFYRCGFYGIQDTLWDDRGRHYYNLCTIHGAVDFIFGSGQSIFEKCSIAVMGEALAPGLPAYITAQARSDPRQSNGFIFRECNVYGSGSAYLGRPWRGYSRVIFYNTNLSKVINPLGWDSWHFDGSEYQLTYAEYGCFGPGSNMTQRVSWEKNLSLETVQQFASMGYIDNEGWVQNQPAF